MQRYDCLKAIAGDADNRPIGNRRVSAAPDTDPKILNARAPTDIFKLIHC